MKGKSKAILIIALAIVALGLAGFGVMHFMMTPPDDLDLSRAKASAAGVYRLSIEPEAGEIRQNELHSWVITVETPDGRAVEDASIAVDGGMPQHGHGLPTNPQVTAYLGQGRYRVEGVRFNMGGWWEFRFAVSSPAGADEAVFNLSL